MAIGQGAGALRAPEPDPPEPCAARPAAIGLSGKASIAIQSDGFGLAATLIEMMRRR